ncbi:MAG: hypothetical protein LC772_09180, partial [Chloroflexi bacterium]|nr:hypothetical protein [Chloroflexota bacterium]
MEPYETPRNDDIPAVDATEPVPLKERQHAPTLLTAEDRGAGDVRVWSPNIWLGRSMLVYGVGYVLFALGSCGHYFLFKAIPGPALQDHFPIGLDLSFMLLFAAALLLTGWKTLRRPKYVTTDGHGIAVTTRKGARALSWDEINGARLSGDSLKIDSDGGRVGVQLPGYMRSVQKELFATVAQRAGLYSAGRGRCVRPEQLGNRPRVQPPFPPATGCPPERLAIRLFALSAIFSTVLVLVSLAGGLAIMRLAHAF